MHVHSQERSGATGGLPVAVREFYSNIAYEFTPKA